MNIALFHNRYRIPGGEDRTVEFEHALLESAGHRVSRYEVSNEQVFARPGLAAIRSTVSAAWNGQARRDVHSFLAACLPDVGHVHNWFPLLSPSIYAAHRDLGIPVVQTLHNYRLGCAAGTFLRDGRPCEDCIDGDRRPAIQHGCYRGSAVQSRVWCRVMERGWSRGSFQTLVDAYIAPSQVVAAKHRRMGLPEELIEVIPHACVDPTPDRADRTVPATRGGGVFVGRLMPEKGVDTLIEAWRGVGAPLTIVGSGPEEDRLRRLAADVPDVEFTGGLTHDEAIRRIFAADFLVFPSRWEEPFGLTIIEAFACGRPVIAANIGAPRELISHDVTGLLVPPDEPEALSSAARYLTREDEHRRGMALNARRRYLQRHTPAVHRRRLLQLFTRVGAMRERQLTA